MIKDIITYAKEGRLPQREAYQCEVHYLDMASRPVKLEFGGQKCDRSPRSCFIGFQASNISVSILALIRLSDARVRINLLFHV